MVEFLCPLVASTRLREREREGMKKSDSRPSLEVLQEHETFRLSSVLPSSRSPSRGPSCTFISVPFTGPYTKVQFAQRVKGSLRTRGAVPFFVVPRLHSSNFDKRGCVFRRGKRRIPRHGTSARSRMTRGQEQMTCPESSRSFIDRVVCVRRIGKRPVVVYAYID